MTVKHDPPNSYGDCYRCAIASILEVAAEDVPHVYLHGNDYWDTGKKLLDEWLAKQNLYIFEFCINAANMEHWSNLGYHLLSGVSPRGSHACVGHGGKLVHNPNPLNDGLKPYEDGTYQLGFICRGG